MAAEKKDWSTDTDTRLRALVEKHGDSGKWATIAVEGGKDFGFDSEACEKRYHGLLNPKLDAFAFGGATKGGAFQAHSLVSTGKAGNGFGMAYYPTK